MIIDYTDIAKRHLTAKLHTLQIAMQRKLAFFDSFIRAFEMRHAGNEYFKPYIQPLLDERSYNEAAQCIAFLDLQAHYDTYDVCLPLILQDKVNLVEKYVFQNRAEQKRLLLMLDWLIDDKTNIDDVIR